MPGIRGIYPDKSLMWYCALMQMLFLGQLTMLESAKLTERLAKFIMLKMVFIGAVSAPTRIEIVMWFSW